MKPRPIDAGFDPTNPTPPFQRWIKNLQRYLYQQQAEHKFGQRKPKVTDVIALGHANDPFYIGGAAPEKLAASCASEKAIRDRRRTLRYRQLLVPQMVQMKKRVSGLLMVTGVEHNKQRLHKVG
jgi:hypothetical protein